jgi:hypothetical protein
LRRRVEVLVVRNDDEQPKLRFRHHGSGERQELRNAGLLQ